MTETAWKATSYGAGPRHWYVTRKVGGRTEVLEDAAGNYRRYGSHHAASKIADLLNAGGQIP